MTTASTRINIIADKFKFSTYLEIGIRKGNTFTKIALPHKTGVDPEFAFDIDTHKSPLISYFPTTSDVFFSNFPRNLAHPPYNYREKFSFDIIYIDGLHTFEQSYRDFKNSIPFSHDKTVWIFDDTVPSDPWSALPDQEVSFKFREMAGVSGHPWHGDVYKTIFAIHDFHKDFSYATQIDVGNPQTIVWKSNTVQRQQFFSNIEDINSLSYFDMLDNIHFLCPTSDLTAIEMIGMEVNPSLYKDESIISKIIKKIKIQI